MLFYYVWTRVRNMELKYIHVKQVPKTIEISSQERLAKSTHLYTTQGTF